MIGIFHWEGWGRGLLQEYYEHVFSFISRDEAEKKSRLNRRGRVVTGL